MVSDEVLWEPKEGHRAISRDASGSRDLIELLLEIGDEFPLGGQLLIDVLEVRHEPIQHLGFVNRPREAAQTSDPALSGLPGGATLTGRPADTLRSTRSRRACLASLHIWSCL